MQLPHWFECSFLTHRKEIGEAKCVSKDVTKAMRDQLTVINVTEGTAAELAGQSVFSTDSKFHFDYLVICVLKLLMLSL